MTYIPSRAKLAKRNVVDSSAKSGTRVNQCRSRASWPPPRARTQSHGKSEQRGAVQAFLSVVGNEHERTRACRTGGECDLKAPVVPEQEQYGQDTDDERAGG